MGGGSEQKSKTNAGGVLMTATYTHTDLDIQNEVGWQLGEFKPLQKRLTMGFVLLQ